MLTDKTSMRVLSRWHRHQVAPAHQHQQRSTHQSPNNSVCAVAVLSLRFFVILNFHSWLWLLVCATTCCYVHRTEGWRKLVHTLGSAGIVSGAYFVTHDTQMLHFCPLCFFSILLHNNRCKFNFIWCLICTFWNLHYIFIYFACFFERVWLFIYCILTYFCLTPTALLNTCTLPKNTSQCCEYLRFDIEYCFCTYNIPPPAFASCQYKCLTILCKFQCFWMLYAAPLNVMYCVQRKHVWCDALCIVRACVVCWTYSDQTCLLV